MTGGLPVRPLPQVRHIGWFRWVWWVSAGKYGGQLCAMQIARTGRAAWRRAEAAAAHLYAESAGLCARDANAELRCD